MSQILPSPERLSRLPRVEGFSDVLFLSLRCSPVDQVGRREGGTHVSSSRGGAREEDVGSSAGCKDVGREGEGRVKEEKEVYTKSTGGWEQTVNDANETAIPIPPSKTKSFNKTGIRYSVAYTERVQGKIKYTCVREKIRPRKYPDFPKGLMDPETVMKVEGLPISGT